MLRLGIVAAAILVAACDGGPASGRAPTPPADAGPVEACGPGTAPSDDGECVGAGVPRDACPPGFEHDGMGCLALLPDGICPAGTMALPGDAECHDVAPCPPGRWGDIPVEQTTEHVDASYAGADSDGAADRPWTAIQAAATAAMPGAIVAIAAGTYSESVWFGGKALRLWGVCPGQVSITGPPDTSGLFMGENTAGSEVHTLSITGAYAFTAAGEGVVTLDRVWIHGTTRPAVTIADVYGVPEVVIADSLIEDSAEVGVLLAGSSVVIERSVVRGTRAGGTGLVAGGVSSVSGIDSMARSSIAIRSSIVEDNLGVGVASLGGDLEVTGSVIRDTGPVPSNGEDGEGILGALEIETGYRARVVVVSSVIERSREAGILLVDSDAELDGTTVRDTLPQVAGPKAARGVAIQRTQDIATPPTASIVRSSILGSAGFGVFVSDGELAMSSALVAGTSPEVQGGTFGDGILALALWHGARVTIERSRVEGSARAGVVSFGAAVDIWDSRLECNGVHLDGELSDHGAFAFDDGGGNACGCGVEDVTCSVLTSSLAPPDS